MSYSPPSIDWKSFTDKLTAIAIKWFRLKGYFDGEDFESVLKGVASSPRDLAQNAAMEIFRQLEKYKPKSEDDCFRLAYRIMQNDFIDLLRKPHYRKTDAIEDFKIEIILSTPSSVEKTLVADAFYDLAEGEQELIDFIDAVISLKVYKREDVADLLNISLQEVTNRQRILTYRGLKDKKLSIPLKTQV